MNNKGMLSFIFGKRKMKYKCYDPHSEQTRFACPETMSFFTFSKQRSLTLYILCNLGLFFS